MSGKTWNVMVTGGAGYVGSALVPKLLDAGHGVTVLDLCLYGSEFFDPLRQNERFRLIEGDIREARDVNKALEGCDAVIHLACISNDPSYDLDPNLGKSINYDCFRPLVKAAKANGVGRFIYASSSSVYGIKSEPAVTEELALEPLTDYSKFKALCEEILAEEREPGFVTCVIRPSTVCGYAPRQRLDVIVNILTNHAVNTGRIRVFGGEQKRPNLHIDDMVDLYLHLLQVPDELIDGQIFNAGIDNYAVMELAEMVKRVVGGDLAIDVVPTDDNRSYHVSSEKMRTVLGFNPSHTVEDAVRDLVNAFNDGALPDSMDGSQYFNIKRMQEVSLK